MTPTDKDARIKELEAELARLKTSANFHRDLGIATMDAKWLDPECHKGCQSLVYKHLITALEVRCVELREAAKTILKEGIISSGLHVQTKILIRKTAASYASKVVVERAELDDMRKQITYLQQRLESQTALLPEEVSDFRNWQEGERLWKETEAKTPAQLKADLAEHGYTEEQLIESRRKCALKISPELSTELDTLRKDRERLDWLETANTPTKGSIALLSDAWRKEPDLSMRSAIDAAMAKKECDPVPYIPISLVRRDCGSPECLVCNPVVTSRPSPASEPPGSPAAT